MWVRSGLGTQHLGELPPAIASPGSPGSPALSCNEPPSEAEFGGSGSSLGCRGPVWPIPGISSLSSVPRTPGAPSFPAWSLCPSDRARPPRSSHLCHGRSPPHPRPAVSRLCPPVLSYPLRLPQGSRACRILSTQLSGLNPIATKWLTAKGSRAMVRQQQSVCHGSGAGGPLPDSPS